jgi:hypothetical protein
VPDAHRGRAGNIFVGSATHGLHATMENPMTAKTAAHLVAEANAQIDNFTP